LALVGEKQLYPNKFFIIISLMPYNKTLITETKKGKVREFGIDVGLRNEMVCRIRDIIIRNLGTTKRLLELGEDYKDVCAGIITYAIEEYGKILFLNSISPFHPPHNNRVRVPYTSENNGFLDHYHKFDLALYYKELPYSCKVLYPGDFIFTDFESSDFVTDTPADFLARKSIFYTDFDKKGNYNSILPPLQVDMGLLEDAVEEFSKFMNAQRYPYGVFMMPLSALTLPSRIGMETSTILNGSNTSIV
jgi:hypothetical protein